MKNYKLIQGVQGWLTAPDSTTIPGNYLVAGSKNVIISRQRKFGNRAGYSLKGASNSSLTPVLNGTTWSNNTGGELPMRFYDDELEVWLGTVDGTAINAWTRVKDSITADMIRFATWWDTTEKLDLLLYVIGDSTISEWGGGVAVVSSITGTTITKTGTATFGGNRFYTTRNKSVTCVRTGTAYTYTGGETTTTLTGIADTTGLIAGDILVQTVVVNSNKPASGYDNDTIYTYQNQLVVASDTNNDVYLSTNTAYATFTIGSPRVPGGGEVWHLDAPCKGCGVLSGKLVLFSGKDYRYVISFNQITVSTTLTETTTLEKFSDTNLSAQSQEVIAQIGEGLAYLSYEPALHILTSADALKDPKPSAVSNPIKPDFDAETWTSAHLVWGNARLHLSSPTNSKLYILDFTEDAEGKTQRFWQAPQILPVRAMGMIGGSMHFHSNSVPETYKMFDELSDRYYSGIDTADKLPINAIAKLAYFNGGQRGELKCFDEFFVEGEISRNTINLVHTINYEFGGALQQIINTINGSDETILFQKTEDVSLGQNPLGQKPLGGAIDQASDSAKFRVVFEEPKEDFYEIQEMYESNDVDFAWTVISSGQNSTISPRRNSSIGK